VLQDFFNDIGLVNEADDPYLPFTLRAGKRVGFINFSNKVGPEKRTATDATIFYLR